MAGRGSLSLLDRTDSSFFESHWTITDSTDPTTRKGTFTPSVRGHVACRPTTRTANTGQTQEFTFVSCTLPRAHAPTTRNTDTGTDPTDVVAPTGFPCTANATGTVAGLFIRTD